MSKRKLKRALKKVYTRVDVCAFIIFNRRLYVDKFIKEVHKLKYGEDINENRLWC